MAKGKAASGVFTDAFGLTSVAGDTGKSYADAMELCHSSGKALCTETQWEKACAADATLATVETWTASWDGKSVVARGGGTCDGKKLDTPAGTNPARKGLCCDRAVGIRSANTDESFVLAAATRQLSYEKALNAQDIDALDKLYGPMIWIDVEITGEGLEHGVAMKSQKGWFKQYPKQWTIYDVCDSAVGPIPRMVQIQVPEGLVNDCAVIVMLGEKLHVVKQKVGWWTDLDDSSVMITYIKHHGDIRPLGPL